MRHLRAENKSPRTIQSYSEAATQLLAFLTSQGMPTTTAGIAREQSRLSRWRSSASTGRQRWQTVIGRSNGLESEGEITTSPMAKMTGPKVPEQPVAVLTDDQMRKLLAACNGHEFNDRRDTAIVRLMADTGLRRGEVAGLTVSAEPEHPHVELDDRSVLVLGKGGSWRVVPIGAKAMQAIDRADPTISASAPAIGCSQCSTRC